MSHVDKKFTDLKGRNVYRWTTVAISFWPKWAGRTCISTITLRNKTATGNEVFVLGYS